MDSNNTYQWSELRYGYYLAGRTLLFNNQMQSGVLMLGYAVEAHFKHMLSQDKTISETNRVRLDWHD